MMAGPKLQAKNGILDGSKLQPSIANLDGPKLWPLIVILDKITATNHTFGQSKITTHNRQNLQLLQVKLDVHIDDV